MKMNDCKKVPLSCVEPGMSLRYGGSKSVINVATDQLILLVLLEQFVGVKKRRNNCCGFLFVDDLSKKKKKEAQLEPKICWCLVLLYKNVK